MTDVIEIGSGKSLKEIEDEKDKINSEQEEVWKASVSSVIEVLETLHKDDELLGLAVTGITKKGTLHPILLTKDRVTDLRLGVAIDYLQESFKFQLQMQEGLIEDIDVD